MNVHIYLMKRRKKKTGKGIKVAMEYARVFFLTNFFFAYIQYSERVYTIQSALNRSLCVCVIYMCSYCAYEHI